MTTDPDPPKFATEEEEMNDIFDKTMIAD